MAARPGQARPAEKRTVPPYYGKTKHYRTVRSAERPGSATAAGLRDRTPTPPPGGPAPGAAGLG
eukprot:275437-Hanusia_phi.AAC.2